MRYSRSTYLAPLLLLAFVIPFTPSGGEVSVVLDDGQPGSLPSGVLSVVDEPGPWPHRWTPVRSHVNLEFMLNVGGDGRGDGEPDFDLNLAAGSAEVVWAFWDGADFEIAHSRWSGEEWSTPVFLTNNEVDDLDPRLVVTELGGLKVTWWRGGAESSVLLAERAGSVGAFGPETVVSDGDGSCQASTVAIAGDTTFVSYEGVEGSLKTVTVESSSAGSPFVPEVIASTTRQDELEVEVQAEGDAVWVVWIDSGTHLGWSERDATGWSSPNYEPYAGEGDIDRCRLRIKRLAIR